MDQQVILKSILKKDNVIIGYRCEIKGNDELLTLNRVKELIKLGVVRNAGIKIFRGKEKIVVLGKLVDEQVVEGINHMRARRYMEKQKLLGIDQLELRLTRGDGVLLVKVNDVNGKKELVLPSFITNIKVVNNKLREPYSAFSGTHYEKIIINKECSIKGDYLFYGLYSERLKVIYEGDSLKSMEHMFSHCMMLKELDISGINTSNVRDMNHAMFMCQELVVINLGDIDTSKVENMRCTFGCCMKLRDIDLSKINTNRVTNMKNMFTSCRLLRSIDLSSWNTSSVKAMSGMFYGCVTLKKINLTGLDTSNVRDMDDMFNGCRMLEEIDISKLDTRRLVYMENMFNGCVSLKELNLSGLMLGSVKQILGMFNMCFKLEKIDLSSFNFSNLTCSDISFIDIFNGCINLKVIKRPYNGILNDVPKGVKLI